LGFLASVEALTGRKLAPQPFLFRLGEACLEIGPERRQARLTDIVDGLKLDFNQVCSHCGALTRIKIAAQDAVGFANSLGLFDIGISSAVLLIARSR
jgi:hypothetical protein